MEKEFIKDLSLILSERSDQYGPSSDSFKRIAEIWSWYLEARNRSYSSKMSGCQLEARDIPCMMMLFKIARIINSDSDHIKSDSLLDLAGYASLMYEDTNETS